MNRRFAMPAAILFCALSLCAISGAAIAQDHPVYLPQHDVTVTYAISGVSNAPNAPASVRVAIASGGMLARIDPEGLPGYMLMDRSRNRFTIILAAQRLFMDLPAAMHRANEYLPDADTRFSVRGHDSVAGYRCTVWQMTSPRATGTGCITEDGVILRGETRSKDGPVRILATSVTYGQLPDDLFTPPPGFQQVEIPNIPGLPRLTH